MWRIDRAHAKGSQYRFRNNEETSMIERVSTILLVFALLTGWALGQTTPQASGSIQGVVFTTDQDHTLSVVPRTKLSLDGTVHLVTESKSDGTFLFSNVPPGAYTIDAQA